LSEAHNQGVLIFASASNSGANDPISFPANLPYVFCIGAADGMGRAANFTSHRYGVEKFTALGVGVEGANVRFADDETQSLNVRRSGTSTAAPIASGIAAIFVEYTQQFLNGDRITREQLRKLFYAISKETDGHPNLYLAPWEVFRDCEHSDVESVIGQILESPVPKPFWETKTRGEMLLTRF
jgi:subtilisin family serine protease